MTVEQKSPIPRRAIAKGIAWSVPAFAIATAAPALAQSPLIDIVEGSACKYAGNSGPTGTFQSYLFPVTITNKSNEPVCITAKSARVVLTGGTTRPGTPVFWNKAPGSAGAVPGGTQVCLGVGESATYWLVLTNTGSSSNLSGTAYVDVLVEGQTTGRAYTDQASVSFGDTPPSCDGAIAATSSTAPEEAAVTEDAAKSSEPSSDGDTPAQVEATQEEAPAPSDGADAEQSAGTSTEGDGAAEATPTEDSEGA